MNSRARSTPHQHSKTEYSATKNSNLKQHSLKTRHERKPAEGKEILSLKCPICDYKGKNKSRLTTHIKSHTLEKWFKCDEPDSNCNFEAKTKKEINKHRVVHSHEKPFACPTASCGLRCKRKFELALHLKTHGEERQYKCELCPFRAKTRSTVTQHLKNVHSDPNFRPFKCTEPKCDYAAKKKGTLLQHILVHKGEKKYSCSFPGCEYKAIVASMVKSHQVNIHETERKFKCGLCQFAAKTNGNLADHVRTHTKEKRSTAYRKQ